MADLVITAANVALSSGSTGEATAAATITAGQALALDSSGDAILASDATDAATAACVGIALHGASAGQPIKYANAGSINLGATLSLGKVYVLSTSGGIAPVDDIASTEFITVLGVATTTALLKLSIIQSGVQAAAAVA